MDHQMKKALVEEMEEEKKHYITTYLI